VAVRIALLREELMVELERAQGVYRPKISNVCRRMDESG